MFTNYFHAPLTVNSGVLDERNFDELHLSVDKEHNKHVQDYYSTVLTFSHRGKKCRSSINSLMSVSSTDVLLHVLFCVCVGFSMCYNHI